MQRVSFAEMECSIARSADLLGDGWSLLLLRNAFFGTRTFQDFERQLGVPPSTLTRKLNLLTEQGLLERMRYSQHPPRDEYLLSDKGRDLLPVLVSLLAWGNRWLSPQGAPSQVIDVESGAPVEPVMIDRRTGRELSPGKVAIAAGPGASQELQQQLERPLVLGKRRPKKNKGASP